MKTLFVYVTLIFISNSYSQNWQSVTSNTTSEIKDMYFQNETVGFAVAGEGKILKTMDSGETWNLIYENSELNQNQSITATNDKVFCFAQNFDGDLKKLEFLINTTDYEISNFVNSWTPNNPITYNSSIYEGGNILIDNIFTPLSSVPTATGSSVATCSESSNNDSNITCSDNYYIYYSNDGNLWNTIQFHPFFLNSGPYQSYWDGNTKMRAVTNYPCVVHISNDNGTTWTYNQTNIQSLYFYFINAEKVLGLNLFSDATPENKIYYSSDSGINFSFETVASPVKKIYKYNSNLIFAFGENGVIYKSTNAGGLLNKNDFKKKVVDINVYPNPSKNGEINISYDEAAVQIKAITVVNNIGAEIIVLKSNIKKINVSNFCDGIYYLKFDTDNGMITKKMIIKK